MPGTWTDNYYGYEWVLAKGHHHTLTGSVHYGGVPCEAQTSPVTGTFKNECLPYGSNPDNDGCVSFWTYTMTVK